MCTHVEAAILQKTGLSSICRLVETLAGWSMLHQVVAGRSRRNA
jgi:hypothetical protein